MLGRASWIQPAIERARKLWKEQYAITEIHSEQTTSTDTSEPSARPEEPSFFQQQLERYQRRQAMKDEFETFIEGGYCSASNAIAWWLEDNQQCTYPRLSKMAIDVLSAQGMSAESERVFSMVRRTISWDRTSLKASTVEQMELQKSWIKQDIVEPYYGSDSEDSDGEEGDSEVSDSWTVDTTPSTTPLRASTVDITAR